MANSDKFGWTHRKHLIEKLCEHTKHMRLVVVNSAFGDKKKYEATIVDNNGFLVWIGTSVMNNKCACASSELCNSYSEAIDDLFRVLCEANSADYDFFNTDLMWIDFSSEEELDLKLTLLGMAVS